MVAGTAATLLGAASTSGLSRLLGGKKRTLLILLAANIAGFVVFQLAGPRDFGVMFATQIVGSYTGGPLFPLIWSMYADTADYAEWKTGRRATGLVLSTATFAQKIGWTFGGALAGWILSSFGFHANVQQSALALAGIRGMMGWIPAVMCALGTAMAYLYNLDARTLSRVEAELRDRRRVVEATTGDA
jgi:GPH family glycoside/pentoside/hexuronide:cation symporter